jgi:hypothetical protein
MLSEASYHNMTVGRIPSVEGGIQPTIVDAKGDLIAAVAADSLNRLAVGSNDQVLVADSAASTGLAWKSYGAQVVAGKNAIINGGFDVWQRGTTLTFATTGWFNGAADRWMGYSSANSTATLSQQAFTAGAAPVAGYEGTYFLRSASTSTATYLAQRIEDVRTFAGQTVTISFWAKTNTNQTLSYFNLEQNFGSGGSTTVGNSITPLPALTTSWTKFTATVTLASISGKTIGTSSYLALVLQGDVNKNIDIWGVQVELGSVATPFSRAGGTIQGELAACQRYYYRVNWDATSAYAQFGAGAGNSTTQVRTDVYFPVQLRKAPSAIDYPTVATYFTYIKYDDTGGGSPSAVSLDTNLSDTTVGRLNWTGTSITAQGPYYVRGQNQTGAYLGWSAEL